MGAELTREGDPTRLDLQPLEWSTNRMSHPNQTTDKSAEQNSMQKQNAGKALPHSTPLLRALLKRKTELEQHLVCVCQLLAIEGYTPESPGQPSDLRSGGSDPEASRTHVGLGKTPIKKLEAMRLALSHATRPLKLRELVSAMEAEGFVFQGKVKQHALHNYLYREKPAFLGKTAEGYILAAS